jgi:hypothetical protein
VINLLKLKNPSLLQTTVSAWAMLAKGTEWLAAIHLENMEMDRKLFFHLMDLCGTSLLFLYPAVVT